ncbi:hypothetical protein BHE74_00043515 [Ensete ventricosum]|nr:hypothetical protein GW17_00024722 [Ensete ventricosum]RWW50239.1 hypothetical protein BHE74_00043515 [Ensete ventricosum]
MGSRDMKNKSSGKKLAVASAKVEVENFIGNSKACLYETSQNKMDFSKLLEGVIFALSGFVNPERATLRSKALEMGAEYQPDWTSDCTILVCAFPSTPKFRQVKSDGGTIVSKVIVHFHLYNLVPWQDWISECHSQKRLVDIVPYLMHVGKPWRKSSKQFDFQQGNISTYPAVMAAMSLKCHMLCEVVALATLGTLVNVWFFSSSPSSSSSLPRLRPLFFLFSLFFFLPPSAETARDWPGEHATNVDIQFSPSKIKQWAVDDLHRTMSWLDSQDEKVSSYHFCPITARSPVK